MNASENNIDVYSLWGKQTYFSVQYLNDIV